MKLLAIFAAIVVVGLIAIAGGLRATRGATPSVTPPKQRSWAQFVRAANGVCRRTMREAKAREKGLPSPKKNLRAFVRDMRIAIPLFQNETAGVRALIPPLQTGPTVRRLAGTLQMAEHNAHDLLHAAETRQFRRMVSFARRADTLDKRLNALSRKLGLTVCAKS
jgi:hypothetical protein